MCQFFCSNSQSPPPGSTTRLSKVEPSEISKSSLSASKSSNGSSLANDQHGGGVIFEVGPPSSNFANSSSGPPSIDRDSTGGSQVLINASSVQIETKTHTIFTKERKYTHVIYWNNMSNVVMASIFRR